MLILMLAMLAGCGKPSLSGEYVNSSKPQDTVRFMKDGKWMNSSGMGGSYTRDGDTILLQGMLGLSIKAELKGDTLVVYDRDMMDGRVTERHYTKK